MKIGIYDPYLDSLGGGERYVLTLAEFLSRQEEVEVFWPNTNIGKSVEERLGIKMDKIKFTDTIFTRNKNLLGKLLLTRKYDLIFFLSDGSIPSIFSKKGVLHFQVPFTHIDGQTLLNRIKLTRFQKVVCNSYFTKRFIDKNYGVESLVVYPPVDVEEFKPSKKENLILSVGRFTQTLHTKKQEIMIQAFKEILPKLEGWELILAGGSMAEDEPYVKRLKLMAEGALIKILNNVSFPEIKNLYGQAKIYWHAAGFSEDEEKNPEKMEHFGITTVEAMASGCVPIVFSGGGQKEIVKHGQNGFLWKSKEELKAQTLFLVEDRKREKISQAAQKRSQDFSREKFCQAFYEIIYR